jgi:hypothetical protein
VATALARIGGRARENGSSRTDASAASVRVLAWDLDSGVWTTRRQIDHVTAFALDPSGQRFAAAVGGHVLIGVANGSIPEQRLEPPVAASSLAFGADDVYVIAYAEATSSGGMLHVWRRTDGAHWAFPSEIAPSAMAVTRGGRFVLAAGPHGETTRGGTEIELSRWSLSDPAQKRVAVSVGRRLNAPTTICSALDASGNQDVTTAPIEVTAADFSECNPAGVAPQGFVSRISERQVTVVAAWGEAVARIDHAGKVLLAAVSKDGSSAVTLDEGGRVQLFAVAAQGLIAQVCQRQPAPLSSDLRALLPLELQAIDACGRRTEMSEVQPEQ